MGVACIFEYICNHVNDDNTNSSVTNCITIYMRYTKLKKKDIIYWMSNDHGNNGPKVIN